MSRPFVLIHGHSEYSLLDGLSKIPDMVKRAKELGHPAIALTDHGVMHGAVELYRNALAEGVKPIIGCEAYLRDFGLTSRLKDFSGDGDYRVKDRYHQLILAINPTGYKNLCKLTSIAHLGEGRGAKTSTQETSTKHKGWILLSELEQYSEGLIVTSGCMAGIIPQCLKAGSPELADQMVAWYKRVFSDRFYIEIQDHAANDGSRELNLQLVTLAQKHNVQIVATADNHYTRPCDKSAHDALLCINTKKLLSDEKRMRYEGAYWLPTGDEMLQRLSDYLPESIALEAIENTVKLAERVEDYQLKRKPTPPKFVWLNSYDNADDYLEELAYTGLRERFYGVPPQNYVERLQFELDLFKEKNLAEYFLVVGDICNFCLDNQIMLGSGRGSAAGSLVAYAMRITNIDPVHFGLVLERFINPERMSYPDIDLDIEKERRHEVVEYLAQKYGVTQVAQIATFGKMVSASALKDTGRVLNVNYGAANELSRQIPVVRGKPAKISEMIKDRNIYPEFYDAYKVDQKMPNKEGYENISFKEWVDIAIGIEGTVKSVGVHAAGVVIGWAALDEIIPLMKSKEGGAVSQYAMEDLEYLGLLKMDLLGLKTLTVVRKTIESVKRIKGETINVESINLNDQAVLRSLANSDCAGVFQFEADGAVRLLKQIKPTSIDDVSAITSLNRPGCLDLGMHTDYARRKAGLEPITYLVPELKPILDFTYGLCVFQEQMLNICHKIAGFSLGKSDIARKACLSGDTIINLSDGHRTTLRDFVRDFDTCRSALIGSLDTNTYCEVEGEVIDAFFNGYRDVYQITTKTGRKIKVTTNHQFFKLDNWVSMDEGLKVGDSVAVPIELNVRESIKTSSMFDSLIKACAYLIGDATSDILWDKITSIEYVGVEDVYDLTIDHYANFVANGFYVHNCGKKKEEVIKPLEADFIQGCTDKWIDKDVAAQLWEIVLASAGYTFNASHAYCYSILTMSTAWLKHYYQAPFMAALMSAEEDGDKLTDYLLKARSYGITLFEPNINRSQKDFTCLDDQTILWGLRAIAGVGDTALSAILLERNLNGYFQSWYDFVNRVNLGSDVLAAFIKSGALDCFGLNRRQMVEHIELLKDWKKKDNAREKRLQTWTNKAAELQTEQHQERAVIQKKLKKLEEVSKLIAELSEPLPMPVVPAVEDYPLIINLRGEKEVLGLYASGHPLDSYKVGCNPFDEVVKNKLFISTVLVSSVREANSKSGKMAYCTIEDKEGVTMSLKVFNQQWNLYKGILKPDAVLSITAKAQEWQGRLELILQMALSPTKNTIDSIAEDDEF